MFKKSKKIISEKIEKLEKVIDLHKRSNQESIEIDDYDSTEKILKKLSGDQIYEFQTGNYINFSIKKSKKE